MSESRYWLVVDGTGIRGIVTPSDLLKLPVRVCVFTLITHLEMVMTEVISYLFSMTEEWLSLLSEGRKAKVDEKVVMLKKERMDQSCLSCTDFCDKRDILAQRLERDGVLSSGTKRIFTRDLKAIGDLRDKVAHADGYAEDQQLLLEFVRVVEVTKDKIRFLAQLLSAKGATAPN
jgi:hypothetical protein